MNQVFIGRQPIFRRTLDVFAYELLYRTTASEQAPLEFDDDQATAQVLINAFVDIGLERIVGPHKAFVNLPRNFVTGNLPLLISEAGTVLEILEDCVVDEQLLDSIRNLSSRGFEIALDDFVYKPELEPIIGLADIVKIDLMAYADRDRLADDVAKIKCHNVMLLAEKVETQEDFDFAVNLGCEYFQGFFLSKPNIISKRCLQPNRIALLHLLAKLEKEGANNDELEKIISHDVALSYKLLRYLNSAFFSLPNRVDSIHRALVYLGNRNIKNWILLMLMTSIDDKPNELFKTALVRARMCEKLIDGHEQKLHEKDQYFMVGLLSTLDAILDMTLDEVLKELPVSTEIRSALIDKSGPMGTTLKCVIAYEKGRWDDVSASPWPDPAIANAYLEAIEWADNALNQLADSERAAA